MKNKIIAVAAALLLLATFWAGFSVHRHWFTPTISEQTDTVYVRQTVEMPVSDPVEVQPAGRITMPAGDCTVTADSISAPAVLAEYRDTLQDGTSYVATVSGIQPKLESLQISYLAPTVTTTRTVEKSFRGWIISATSNTSVAASGSNGVLYSLNALECSYNAGPFHAGLQAGAMVEKPFRQNSTVVSPYLGGRITIDIFKISR